MKFSLWGKRLALLLLCFTLGACTVKASYRFLDWIIAWQLDDYVSLTREQQQLFDRELAEILSWHKTTQLPLYRNWLLEGKAQFQQPLEMASFQAWLEQGSGFWFQLMERITPGSARLLSELSDEQVEHFVGELQEGLEDDLDDYADELDDGNVEEQVHKTQKQFVTWLGGLTPAQNQWVQDWVEQRVDTQPFWFANRKEWLKDFSQLLQRRKQDTFEKDLSELFIHTEARRSKEYQLALEENTRSALVLIINLQASLNERQKRHLNKELDYWAQLLEELATE